MAITIKEVTTKSDIKKFVDFQFELYSSSPNWVPPLHADEMKSLMPEENPAFDFCDAKFWLAYNNNKVVGRIGGIINKKHNEKMGVSMARFSRMEFIDDHEVSAALINKVIEWAKEKKMTGIHGPLGFTNLDHQAVLIEGFDFLPSVASEFHMSYYMHHFDTLGLEKEIDWLEFRLTIEDQVPPKAVQMAELIKKRYGFSVKTYKSVKELMPFAPDMFKVLNNAFSELFSVIPFDDKMSQFYIKKYIPMLNPKFVKVVFDKDNQLIGFVIGVPSLSKAMQKAKGKLFPFGFLHIMRALKRPKVVDLFLTAVEPHYQNMGLTAVIFCDLYQTCIDNGVNYFETTGMIESNQKAIQNWKYFQHIQHKRKRCYIKML